MLPLRLSKARRFCFAIFLALFGLSIPQIALAQSSTPSPLLPASPNASLIAALFWAVFFMAVVVFLAVEGLLIYSAIRFRRRSDDEMPTQVYGNTRMEIVWTSGSALIAAAVFLLSVIVIFENQPPVADEVALAASNVCFTTDVGGEQVAAFLGTSTLDVEIVGHQWWWEMNYPAYGANTATDMYVPVGSVVKLQMTSIDVVHSWWIPQLAGKEDVYPGATTYTWFQVQEAGTYEGHCAELCGASHAYMPMRVIAVSPEEFELWAQKQVSDAPEPGDGTLAAQGKELFSSRGCVGCHAISGVNTLARVGPNLTNIAGRVQIAGLMPYSEDNMRRWLQDPVAVKPGALMPNLQLSSEEVEALTAYLHTLE